MLAGLALRTTLSTTTIRSLSTRICDQSTPSSIREQLMSHWAFTQNLVLQQTRKAQPHPACSASRPSPPGEGPELRRSCPSPSGEGRLSAAKRGEVRQNTDSEMTSCLVPTNDTRCIASAKAPDRPVTRFHGIRRTYRVPCPLADERSLA